MNKTDWDVALHNTRVLNDGGSVPNPIQAESYIKYLKENNLWDSCVFFGLGGNKIEPNTDNSCRKLYDLKGNADVFNSTATGQPRYNQDGSLQYDGGDKIQSASLLTSNPIVQCTSNITVICWVNIVIAGYQFIFDRYDTGNLNDSWALTQRADSTLGVLLLSSPNTIMKNYTTISTIGTGWKCLSFTYSVTNGLKLYVNGVEQSVTKITDNANVAIQLGTLPLTLGARQTYAPNAMLNGNKTALPQIYNTTFTPEQMLQNFNNIKPTDISEMYGSLTGAHINRVETSFGSIPVVDKVQSTIDKLKSANLWDSCVFFADARIGVKKDSNQYVNALYDLKANADLVQATGTAQPKYDNGNLLYDGGDKLMTTNIPTSNQIAQCTNAITVICWVNIVNIGTQFIFDRYSTTGGQDVWFLIQTATGVLKAQVMSTPVNKIKEYETINTIGTGWKCIGFTYSVANGMKLYIGGVNQSVSKITDNSKIAMGLTTSPLALGQRTGSTSNPMLNGNKTDLHQIYNVEFTESQMLWNFNNIRPEGV